MICNMSCYLGTQIKCKRVLIICNHASDNSYHLVTVTESKSKEQKGVITWFIWFWFHLVINSFEYQHVKNLILYKVNWNEISLTHYIVGMNHRSITRWNSNGLFVFTVMCYTIAFEYSVACWIHWALIKVVLSRRNAQFQPQEIRGETLNLIKYVNNFTYNE